MNEALRTSDPTSCGALPSAIFSPELVFGPTLCAKPDGPTTGRCGPEVALANLSARQAKEAGLLTSGTYGPRFITSSGSVRLETSLVNRLVLKTASLGSALFRLTWKQRDTPLGVSICALRASARRTSDKDCTSWPSPSSSLGGKNERTVEGAMKEAERKGWNNDLCTAALSCAPWITPQTHDTTVRGNVTADHHYSPHDLSNQALLAAGGWITPQRKSFRCGQAKRGRVAWLTDSGPEPTGSSAATGSTGQLNPALPRWLQALPTAWDDCAAMVTRSPRKSRKASSKLT
jgi:hypothetical protein